MARGYGDEANYTQSTNAWRCDQMVVESVYSTFAGKSSALVASYKCKSHVVYL